jgi:glycosyltransferase involved in cell wall biosynthesis
LTVQKPKLHVVILDENLPVPLDRRVWLEATALRDAGWQVSVVAPRGDTPGTPWIERIDGVLILRYPQRSATGLAGYAVEYVPSMLCSLLWLLVLRLRGRVDVVHGCNPPDLFFLLGRLAKLWGAHYVFDQHDANPELARTKWGTRRLGPALVRLTQVLEAASYRAASLVIVPNHAYATIARTRGGVRDEHLVIAPNAPRTEEFEVLRSGVEPPPGPFRIGYLGVMGAQDGVELLIDAVAELQRRSGVAIEAHLVGDGESRQAVEARARRLGVEDRIRFYGYQPPSVFVPLLAACHVCVSPDPVTPFNDVSTMTKVVEYLAIRRPVVAFDLSETRRLVGSAGVIVDTDTSIALAEAFDSLATDSDALARVTAAAATRFDELDLTW